MKKLITSLFCLLSLSSFGQLKFIIEDFEGFANGQTQLDKEGLFTYGNISASVKNSKSTTKGYSGKNAVCISTSGKESFGGWGKGLTLNIQIEPETDHLNFYILNPTPSLISYKVIIQDDDNFDSNYHEGVDDIWQQTFTAEPGTDWQLISLPLKKFSDGNAGGDGILNINYKEGKLLAILFSGENNKAGSETYFDFLSFSKGKLPVGATVFDPPTPKENFSCALGAWSEEGNNAEFSSIATSFESQFPKGRNKLEVVHFFYPFSAEKGSVKELYPSIEKINEVIDQGYKPMITLENHYLKVNKKQGQPNLYSIVEGHFDYFFSEWARRIKNANGDIYLRILHEFNGNWYPWCVSDNDKNPQVYIQAYRRIHDIFREQGANNVKFIWCPNSMSVPQESWNYIMDAYPGDEYVDFVGMDVYNGAGESGVPIWRSFRKEAIETYFLLTEKIPNKPLFICETASRERFSSESKDLQTKAEWIEQMQEALKTDLSKIKMVVWFNEYEKFKVNSSPASKRAFTEFFWNDEYFSSSSKVSLQKK